MDSDGTNSLVERNGLHVLLPMTSLSYTCFTLHEWAIIAICSALEKNTANQAVVAELEARTRSVVQSAALEEMGKMGIRVNLDWPETLTEIFFSRILKKCRPSRSAGSFSRLRLRLGIVGCGMRAPRSLSQTLRPPTEESFWRLTSLSIHSRGTFQTEYRYESRTKE